MAIVGAGMAGLSCAEALVAAGARATLFDKGRRPGGRVSTRHVGTHGFDHGAQYFTVRSALLSARLRRWRRAGVVAAWRPRLYQTDGRSLEPRSSRVQRYVGVPGMSALGEAMAAGHDVHCSARIGAIDGEPGAWVLRDATGGRRGPFDALCLALPPSQAAALLESLPEGLAGLAGSAELRRRLTRVMMQPCWAALVAYEAPRGLPFDGLFVHDHALGWIARDSAKPGRPAGAERWVLHASDTWSRAHLELDPDQAAARLLDAFWQLAEAVAPSGLRPARGSELLLQAHRWRYARPAGEATEEALLAPALGIAVCGDWCCGGRVEGAIQSGEAAAQRLIARLTANARVSSAAP